MRSNRRAPTQLLRRAAARMLVLARAPAIGEASSEVGARLLPE
ncbi:hypothetical protein [Mycobacterium sp. 23]